MHKLLQPFFALRLTLRELAICALSYDRLKSFARLEVICQCLWSREAVTRHKIVCQCNRNFWLRIGILVDFRLLLIKSLCGLAIWMRLYAQRSPHREHFKQKSKALLGVDILLSVAFSEKLCLVKSKQFGDVNHFTLVGLDKFRLLQP